MTASYDLNREQMLELAHHASVDLLEVVIHQHMPMFHMEHCVFCAVLSPGTNKTNCGRPCDRHEVRLRDRVGVEHPLQADVGCRNTIFNATPQSGAEVVEPLLELGVRRFRVELLADDSPVQLCRCVDLYRDLLAGEVSGLEVWTKLKAVNRVGVTRGRWSIGGIRWRFCEETPFGVALHGVTRSPTETATVAFGLPPKRFDGRFDDWFAL